MAKIFYVTETAADYITAHFFKTEKEALKYGKSQLTDFEMMDDMWGDGFHDEENDTWFVGESINTQSGILFSFEEGSAYIQSADDEEAREYVKNEVGSDGAAMFFDKFRKGMYGYLGNGADGKGFKWEWDGDEINESNNESNKKTYKMKNIKTFEAFTTGKATTETVTEAVNASGYIKAGKLGYNDQFVGRQSLSMTLSLDLGFNKKDQYGGGNFIGFDHVSMYGTGKEGTILDDALTGKYTYDELKAAAAEHFGL